MTSLDTVARWISTIAGCVVVLGVVYAAWSDLRNRRGKEWAEGVDVITVALVCVVIAAALARTIYLDLSHR